MVERNLTLLGSLVVAVLTTHAQADIDQYRYIADLSGVHSIAREKVLSEALNAWDPSCTYHFQQSGFRVELLVRRPLDRAAFAQYLNTAGFALAELQRWNAATDAMETVKAADPEAYPEYVDTGDRTADNAAYDKAKAAWIARHPMKDNTPGTHPD